MSYRIRWSGPRRQPLAAAAVTAAVLILFSAPPAAAQSSVPTTVGRSLEALSPVVADDALRISLDDAIEIALRQNLDINVQRFDRSQALYSVEQNRGIFDLRGFVSTTVAQSDQPNTTQLEGAAVLTTDNRRFDLGLDQLTAFGGEASLRMAGDRLASNSTNALINPEFGADASLTFAQPLLRGFGKLATKRPILLASIGSEVNRELFEQEVIRVTQQVENAYWGLVEAREQLVVAEQSLKLARELDERNRVQVEVGTLAPIELVQSEATVATRQEQIIRARAAVDDAADLLAQLLNLDVAAYWDLEMVPTTDPVTEPIAIDLAAATSKALAGRPELRIEELNIETARIDYQFLQRERLPQVDLVLTYGGTGTAGRGNVFTPEGDPVSVDTDLTDAFDTAFQRDFDNWALRLDVSYPIQNRAARAQAMIADLEVQRARTVMDRQRLAVVAEVRTAARGVETAAQQIESAKVSRRLQQRNLEAEQKRYENGMSTSFQVTQIQDDLTQARSREVSAITGYRRALTEYYRAVGSLLEVNNIELIEPADEMRPSPRTEAAAEAAEAEPAETAGGEV